MSTYEPSREAVEEVAKILLGKGLDGRTWPEYARDLLLAAVREAHETTARKGGVESMLISHAPEFAEVNYRQWLFADEDDYPDPEGLEPHELQEAAWMAGFKWARRYATD